MYDLVFGKGKRAGYTQSRDTAGSGSKRYYAKGSLGESTMSDTSRIIEQDREGVNAQEYHRSYNGAQGIIKMTDIEVQRS